VLLAFAASASFWKRPQAAGVPNATVAEFPRLFALIIAFPIGVYDGFFGPGTGTFLLLAYAYLYGDELVLASGNAKVANFASNLVAFATFAASGAIVWKVAIPMGIAQLLGALFGTRLAVRRGAGLVRTVAITVSVVLAARVLHQMLRG
jgi:uncharacterized membrane protein YfcA